MLNDDELVKVQQLASSLRGDVTLVIHGAVPHDPFEIELLNTARQISGVTSGRIGIDEDPDPPFPDKPSITVTTNGRRNIRYLAVPKGREFQPFLDILAWMGNAEQPPALPTEPPRDVIADVRILMAEMCPHCPPVVRIGLSIAAIRPGIGLSVIDALRFGDLADRYKVKSTPTVVINEGATLVGQVTADQIVRHLTPMDTLESFVAVIESMIGAGRAEDAAALICREQRPEAILPIYRKPEFAWRIGALTTMEEALERDPDVFNPIVADFCEMLAGDEPALRGDTAELLGKIGAPSAVEPLKRALEHETDPDVREAMEEALAELS